MTQKEFTLAQQWTWGSWLKGFFRVPDFVPPTSDCPPDRFTITNEVWSSTPIEWPEGWADLRLDMHQYTKSMVGPDGTSTGWPVQRYAPNAIWEDWTQIRYGMRSPVSVPVPLDMPRWLEGMPRRGGEWDRHQLLVCGNEAVEMIWAVPGRRECTGWGRWVDGVLVEGRAVCRAGVSLTARLWDRGDDPHRLAVHISGSDDDPSSHFTHPTVGDVLRLSSDAAIRLLAKSTTDDQRRWIVAATSMGMEVVDRNGDTEPHMLLATVSGSQWKGHALQDLDVRMSDLELVQ